MNEPKQYEVQFLVGTEWKKVDVTDAPLTWIEVVLPELRDRFRFRELPDGPLFRVEGEQSLGAHEYRPVGYEYKAREKGLAPEKWTFGQGEGTAISEFEAQQFAYRIPPHLVIIPAEPEAQQPSDERVPISQCTKDGGCNTERTCQSQQQCMYAEANDEHPNQSVEPVPTPEPQRETEWRELGPKENAIRTVGDQWLEVKPNGWSDVYVDIGVPYTAFDFIYRKYRRPAPAQREEADGMEMEIAELREKNKATAKDFETAFRLVRQENDALQAERDALAGQLTKIGNACIVGITGAAEDGHETNPEILWKAISESVRLGHERNDEANALRGQLAAKEQDLKGMSDLYDADRVLLERSNNENAALRASLAAAERERDSLREDLTTAIEQSNKAARIIYAMSDALNPAAGEKNVDCAIRVAQSLAAAHAELATCRESGREIRTLLALHIKASGGEIRVGQRGLLAIGLDPAITVHSDDRTMHYVLRLTTPPPSAQA